MDDISIEDKRIVLKDLLVECPMGEALDDCPARDLRKLPVEKRLITVDTMAVEQIEEVVVHHTRCLKKRQGR